MTRKRSEQGARPSPGRSHSGDAPRLFDGRSAMVRGKLVALLAQPPSSDGLDDITYTGSDDAADPDAEATDQATPLWQLILTSKLSTIH